MPRFNQMGPCGRGPRTGRAMGPCGRNRDRGPYVGRRGYRTYGRNFYPISAEEERELLKEEKAYLESRIKELGQILDKVEE